MDARVNTIVDFSASFKTLVQKPLNFAGSNAPAELWDYWTRPGYTLGFATHF